VNITTGLRQLATHHGLEWCYKSARELAHSNYVENDDHIVIIPRNNHGIIGQGMSFGRMFHLTRIYVTRYTISRLTVTFKMTDDDINKLWDAISHTVKLTTDLCTNRMIEADQEWIGNESDGRRTEEWYDVILNDTRKVSVFFKVLATLPFFYLGGRYKDMKKFYCPFHGNFQKVFGICYGNSLYDPFVEEFECECDKNQYFGSIEAIMSHCMDKRNWYHGMLYKYFMRLHYKDHNNLSQLFISNRSSDYESDEE
jgi:hypothetical protein